MIPYETPPAAPRLGTGLKVLGIVQIVFGVIGLIGAPISLAIAMFNAASKDPLQRKLHEALWEGPAGAWSYTQAALGLVFAGLLLAGGVGVVRGKLWGRTASLVYAVGTLVSLAITQAVMIVAVYPMLLDEMSSSSPVTRGGAMGGLIGGVGAALFGAILPLVVLVALARRSAREQLG